MRGLFLVFLVAAATAVPTPKELKDCDPNVCKIEKNCACSSLDPPIANGPQLVMLSFDDSAARLIYDGFWHDSLFGRKNPDGCQIGGTFFVPHEYSDYEVVNLLYNQGFEIGSHSITKNPLESYWKNISKADAIAEMGGQKKIIAKFANIPTDQIVGARLPLLKLDKDSFQALKEAGFLYDNSWATLSDDPYYPHTMDYRSDMTCFGTTCQGDSVPGFWEIPLINWVDLSGGQCNKLLACNVSGTETDLLNWMKREFNAVYDVKNGGNRAPFSFSINYAVLNYIENVQGAILKFLDYLATLKDVFVVNERQVMDWMKKPVTADKYKSCVTRNKAPCKPVTCKLLKGNEERYMKSCVACPKSYPWLGNPEGN